MGHLTLYTGPMKSGKSKKLIQALERYFNLGKNYLVFKPVIDSRDGSFLKSRSEHLKYPAHVVSNGSDLVNIYNRSKKVDFVFIDEVMFYGKEILGALSFLKLENVCVYAAGLDTDFKGDSFTVDAESGLTMLDIAAEFDTVIPLLAKCEVCREPAPFTQRLVEGEPAGLNLPVVLVGDTDYYEARCAKCWVDPKDVS